jgi:hypothetical protein
MAEEATTKLLKAHSSRAFHYQVILSILSERASICSAFSGRCIWVGAFEEFCCKALEFMGASIGIALHGVA